MSGPVWKGTKGPVPFRVDAMFNAETRSYNKRVSYQGDRDAIAGLELQFQQDGISYEASNDGPVYTLTLQTPSTDYSVEAIDRYEIATEVVDIDIWELPSVVQSMSVWDLANPTIQTWRSLAEDAADNKSYTTARPGDLEWDIVVAHLKSGLNRLPQEYLVLRRSRQIDLSYGQGVPGKFNLNVFDRIYTTEQLNLPATVAFTLPAIPTTNSVYQSYFQWGWRPRSQSVEIVGQFVNQTHELVFAPHSLLKWSVASGNLSW